MDPIGAAIGLGLATEAIASIPAVRGAAVDVVIAWHKGRYNEQFIREKCWSSSRQTQENTVSLMYMYLKTATDLLDSWKHWPLPITHPSQRRNLEAIWTHANNALHLCMNPLDALHAVELLVFANYYLTALDTSTNLDEPLNPWEDGKRVAQAILTQHYRTDDLIKNSLQSAVDEELALNKSWNQRLVMRNPMIRRELLQTFVTLNETVKDLDPVSLNNGHPTFPDTYTKASLSVLASTEPHKYAGILSPMISRLIDEPCILFRQTAGGTYRGIAESDATRVVAGTRHGKLTVWDLKTKTIHSWKGQTSEDKKDICGSLGYLKVWDLDPPHHPLCPALLDQTCCSVFANDKMALCGFESGALKMWNLENSQELYAFQGHESGVTCCSIYANNTRAISGSQDGTLKVWDLEHLENDVLQVLAGHTNGVSCCMFANGTGTRAISGGVDGTLKVWDFDEQTPICTFADAHTGRVSRCSLFANDTKAISKGIDGTVKVWNLENHQLLATLNGAAEARECCAVFAIDTKIIRCNRDGTFKVTPLSDPAP